MRSWQRRTRLISGDLTNKQKLGLEERTAFLINFTGVEVQKALSCAGEGVSTRKLYKILANTIIDWHWLSHDDPIRFAFRGVGELVWVPHRFGSLGLVAPSIEYNSNIQLTYGLFANMLDLFASKEYAKWGYREIKKINDQRHILFANYLPYELLQKSKVEQQERFFWAELVKTYCRLPDRTLDALASCRNRTTTTHSLLIQLVNWKRYMGTAFDMLQQVNIVSMDDATRTSVREHIEAARACLKQYFVKIDHFETLSTHLALIKELAQDSELQPFIPCLNETTDGTIRMDQKCEILVELSKYLSALHAVCGEFRKQIRIDDDGERPDLINLTKNLGVLGEILPSGHGLLDHKRWVIPFLQPNEREIAVLCLSLIDEVFGIFEGRLSIQILRPTPHYKDVLHKQYPFPRGHFTKGN
jgi:hypothetical protein